MNPSSDQSSIWNAWGSPGKGLEPEGQSHGGEGAEEHRPTFAELVRRHSTDGSPGKAGAGAALGQRRHDRAVERERGVGQAAQPQSQPQGPARGAHHGGSGRNANGSKNSMFASIGGFEVPDYSSSRAVNNSEAGKTFSSPQNAFGFDELISPRPAHLVPLEAHNLSSLDSLNLGMHDEGANAYYGGVGHRYTSNGAGGGGYGRYAAQPLHSTHGVGGGGGGGGGFGGAVYGGAQGVGGPSGGHQHQGGWHGNHGGNPGGGNPPNNAYMQQGQPPYGHPAQYGGGMTQKRSVDEFSQADSSVSFGGSVLQYQDPTHPARGTSIGTSSGGDKRSSSDSNRGSDAGSAGGVIVHQYGAGYGNGGGGGNGNGQSRGRQQHPQFQHQSQQFQHQNHQNHQNHQQGGGHHHHHNDANNNNNNNSSKNRGYRKYWNQVTSVNKGARNRNNRYSGGGDTSVEGLLEVILQLPPEMSTVPAVASGLHSLDAGALAALLKELNKNRCSHRAQEIFDWLRKLDSNHPLSALCTTMTFTTMISQCGAQHALRRAMELMAEMKQRKIQCNVHTYSALMNVCIKAGELDLALEVYNEMLNEGCTPNLVTYNTLIDVYGKTGQWEEAIGVLDAVEKKGLEPEARTYNTAIIACNQSSRAQEALQIYERMLKANARPTATTYTALISAYGKAGQLDQALQIFESMERHNCEKNVITYSSLISACEKAGQWQLALKLFNDMHKDGCQPNVVTYNSLIAACAQGAQAEKAQQIFDLMQSRGVRADSVTFGALLSAYDRAGDWRNAMSSFDLIRSLGCRPDTVVYNTIVGCLWRTGVVKGQEMAMQIFHNACKQGHFRTSVTSDGLQGLHRTSSNASSPRNDGASGQLTPQASPPTVGGLSLDSMSGINTAHAVGDTTLPRVEFGMHAFTIGSAVLCMFRWLSEIRARAVAQPDLPPELIILTLNKGKPSRDHTYPVIKEALVAKLSAWNAPLDLADIPVGCQIYGKSHEVTKWLDTDAVRRQLDDFLTFANPSMANSTEQLYTSDAITESRCREAFAAVKQLESMNAAMHGAPSNHSPVHDQEELFLEMAAYAKASGSCQDDVLFDGFDLLLRTIEFGDDSIMSYSNHWLVRACYFYAAVLALGESKAAEAVGLSFQPDRQEILDLTERIKQVFNGKLSSISPSRVLKLYFERIGVCFDSNPPIVHPTAGHSFALLPFSVSSVGMRKYSSSVLAAAVLVVGRRNAGISPFWPHVLEQMTGYSTEEGTDLSSAIASVSCLPAGGAFQL